MAKQLTWANFAKLLFVTAIAGTATFLFLFQGISRLEGCSLKDLTGDILCDKICISKIELKCTKYNLYFADFGPDKNVTFSPTSKDRMLNGSKFPSSSKIINLHYFHNESIQTEPAVITDAYFERNHEMIPLAGVFVKKNVSEIIIFIGHKNTLQTVKWSFALGTVLDPLWMGLNTTLNSTNSSSNFTYDKTNGNISYQETKPTTLVDYDFVFQSIPYNLTICTSGPVVSGRNTTGCSNQTFLNTSVNTSAKGKPIYRNDSSTMISYGGINYSLESKGCWICLGGKIECVSKKSGYSDSVSEEYKCDSKGEPVIKSGISYAIYDEKGNKLESGGYEQI